MCVNQPDEFGFSPDDEALERELMAALRPVDPPPGFADRVLARVAEPQQPARGKVLHMPSPARWWTGAIAATLLIGAFAGESVHLRKQRERELQARAQFEIAIQITGRTLAHTREQLGRAGIQLGN